ncbi:MAG: SNF2 helicase associated domain-containing protein [Acidobacteria bacterium]|nr:SNF2 helicase associated domain-containing protein [Acidobacteriota bacterium]
MSLTQALKSFFSKAICDRGRRYYQNGYVRIKEASDNSLQATVRGSDTYTVSLKIRGATLVASCSCPYFDEDYCKHIWATILAAESKGYLLKTSAAVRFLKMDESAYADDDYSQDDEDYLDEEENLQAKRQTVANILKQYQGGQVKPPTVAPLAAPPIIWKKQLEEVNASFQPRPGYYAAPWPSDREILYIVDIASTLTAQSLILELYYREPKINGEWKKPKSFSLSKELIQRLPSTTDREIASLLVGASSDTYGSYYYYGSAAARFRILQPLEQLLIPMICRSGRAYLKYPPDTISAEALVWDEGEAWQFWVEVRPEADAELYRLEGALRRGEEKRNLVEPALLLAGGLVFWPNCVARLDDHGAFSWIPLLRKEGTLSVPAAHRDELLAKILTMPKWPRLDLPEEIRFEETRLTPLPLIKIKQHENRFQRERKLEAALYFDYDGRVIKAHQGERGFFQADKRLFMVRDRDFEQLAAERLQQLGVRPVNEYQPTGRLEFPANKLPKLARTLLSENWHVEAEGKLYRQAGKFEIAVSTGIDWFELNGKVEFGDTYAALPALLAALRRGEGTVMLDDGTFGILPEEWLKKYGMLAEMGEEQDSHIRFKRSQAGLLDALLASQPEATFDAGFQKARDELKNFAGIKAVDPPESFTGTLREYQREGLGWLHFLRQFGFGGCLADDMGLGKTAQTLALLEARRQQRAVMKNELDAACTEKKKTAKTSKEESAKKRESKALSNVANAGEGNESGDAKTLAPSLVVVPKSLVFNWKQEATKFTPEMRVLDHTGGFRRKSTEHFDDYDLILTTYGTLRNDALHFKDYQFDYVVLDESQAIKNANTESAKAARLLHGDYKLALSGTPIENHLGELWSLFEFLNPGLLGSASVFKLSGAGGRNVEEETRDLLARGLRPFILRRTKDQVAKDLPEKLEQTIYCELDKTQRKLYNELRDHYRHTLLGMVDRVGINKSKIMVLEALLRLRQAACHPGLLDKKRLTEASAKLDLLVPRLLELHEEGHKVLVFSQFTSFLAIVKNQLDQENIQYAYLDGKTRDRAARVERFQNDPDCKLFLISLKAGGLGLNLTAAEYVFLLDPWWNPAVEAQAIDRAHRIGQTRNVFAYRLIARDTVEEKVLELQNTKRALAEAIINADNSLIRSLGREDLELLLS